MPSAPDPQALARAAAVVDGLRAQLMSAEDDLFSTLAVMGEPESQRAVDAWLDQCADLVRAVGEAAAGAREKLGEVSVEEAGAAVALERSR